MKVDIVTRLSLVVIAVCLAVIMVKSFKAIPAEAGGEIIKVDIVKVNGSWIRYTTLNVNVEQVGGEFINKKELLEK